MQVGAPVVIISRTKVLNIQQGSVEMVPPEMTTLEEEAEENGGVEI